MSDYWVSIRVRNGRIRRRIAEGGFRSVYDLCRKAGLHPKHIGALLNLKVPPLTHTGSWRRSALDLAEALGCTCEELFSETQRTLALRDNESAVLISEAELLRLASRAEQPLVENPGERLLDDADEHTKIGVVRRALDALRLTARDRRIVAGYFGIGCEERTVPELASEFDVSRQFVEHCLDRTLRRLRHHDRTASLRSLLQAYRPAAAMSRAEEARLKIPQQRAALIRARRAAESLSREQRRLGARPQREGWRPVVVDELAAPHAG